MAWTGRAVTEAADGVAAIVLAVVLGFLGAFVAFVFTALELTVVVFLILLGAFIFGATEDVTDDVTADLATDFIAGAGNVTTLAAPGVGVRLQYQCPFASAQACPSKAVP